MSFPDTERHPHVRHHQTLERSTAAAAALAVAMAAAAVAIRPVASADTGAACSAVYTIGWQTPSNNPPDFGATVTVTNNAAYTINTWTVTWTYADGQRSSPAPRTARSSARAGPR